MDYFNARWYDSALGRFAQADSIVPLASQGDQAWDRYAYGVNNPSRYTDPSGYKACDGAGVSSNDCEISTSDILAAISVSYHWKLVGDCTKKEAFALLDFGILAEYRISSRTNGNGRGWMIRNWGGATIHHGDTPQQIYIGGLNLLNPRGIAGVVPGVVTGRDIYLDDSGFNMITIGHEFTHVLDNNTRGKIGAATWFGGGMGDDLIRFVGGTPTGIRWTNSTDSIPLWAEWSIAVDNGYGNNSTADYFAQAFAYWLVDPAKLPDPSIRIWIEIFITALDN